MDSAKSEEKGLPLIPCVYCSHANPPGHRFCGMCGKALPDLVKQAVRSASEGTSGSPMPGSGIGVAGRSPMQTPARGQAAMQPPSPMPSPTPSQRPPQPAAPMPSLSPRENPNRDLSYLLRDDHTPAKTSRKPFIVGGLILVAVAGFFAMRGGGKAAPANIAAATDASEVQPDSPVAPDAKSPAKPVESAPQAESPTAAGETHKVEPEKVAPVPEEAKPEAPKPVVQEARHSAPPRAIAKTAPAPKPSNQRKPSAATIAVPEAVAAEDPTPSPTGDCGKQLPALQKGAARGDAKAREGLGLIYYAGRCVSRDLPTAYHYYALALHAEPDNTQVSAQLEAIWKQMSPAERQLALKAK